MADDRASDNKGLFPAGNSRPHRLSAELGPNGGLDGDQADLWRRLRGRDIFLWGAGRWGRVICLRLEEWGLEAAGFLDSKADRLSPSVLGRPLSRPEPFLAQGPGGPRGPVLIITPHFFKESMLPQAEAAGFKRGRDLFLAEDFAPHHYIVEVSGVCNLRCLACPRGRQTPQARRGGFMSLKSFRAAAEKIKREDPLAANLQLYQWGEPLLNPELPQMIEEARAAGLPVSISSNLNVEADLERVAAAGPDWFRVSVSGTGSDYERTHAGGLWAKVLANMERLARSRDQARSRMRIEVYYHLYVHNQGRQLSEAREICKRFGFEFQPVQAYLIGLEEVSGQLKGRPFPPEAQQAASLLNVTIDQALLAARRDAALPCPAENVIMVDWDLSAPVCLMYFDRKQPPLSGNFLQTPLAEIKRRRKASPLCALCRSQALHRYCDVYYNWPLKDAE
ncbi:MAG: radical SAM protein [Candidatus Adiutrix sp.]|jgi:pyruvate-formate lyase-activating enzyme|nr:radical SAM protein [Candidatus Adiutrix sp.]